MTAAVASPSPVLILTGAPGSGKTSVAQMLAAGEQRAVHLESDLFFHFIRAGYVEPWRPESHEQNTIVMSAVADAAAAYAGGGYLTIVDGIVSPRWFLVPLRDSLRAAGYAVAYAVLRAPLDTCLARAAQRASRPLADRVVVERLWHEFADLGRLEPHALDSASGTAETTAQTLAERLRDGLLLLE